MRRNLFVSFAVVILCTLLPACGSDSKNLVSPSAPSVIAPVVIAPVVKSISVFPTGIGLVNATEFTFAVDTNVTSQDAFAWQFGDGSSVTGVTTVRHVFNRPGSFTVQVIVTNAAGQVSTSAVVHVASLMGRWIATITGHNNYPPQRPITRVELRFFQSPGASFTRLDATWSDDAGCRAGTGYSNPYIYGLVSSPRLVSVGVEHLWCNDTSDFYLNGTADNEIQVISGTCQGVSGCQFRMVRQ